MRVSDLVERFLADTAARHAERTAETYRQRLTRLVEWYGERELETLTDLDLLEYLDRAAQGKNGKRMAPSTQRSNAVILQTVQRWAVRRHLLPRPILAEIEKPSDRQRDRIPTRQEQAAVLRRAPRAVQRILRGLMLTGARPNELVGADIEHYDRQRRLIELREHKTAAKTGRVRRIGVGRKLARILDRCIGTRKTGPIFLNRRGARWTTQALSHVYRRLREKAGLSRDLCLYAATRHYSGTHVCKKLGLAAASHFLGHASFDTTKRYIHPDDAMLGGYQDQVF